MRTSRALPSWRWEYVEGEFLFQQDRKKKYKMSVPFIRNAKTFPVDFCFCDIGENWVTWPLQTVAILGQKVFAFSTLKQKLASASM